MWRQHLNTYHTKEADAHLAPHRYPLWKTSPSRWAQSTPRMLRLAREVRSFASSCLTRDQVIPIEARMMCYILALFRICVTHMFNVYMYLCTLSREKRFVAVLSGIKRYGKTLFVNNLSSVREFDKLDYVCTCHQWEIITNVPLAITPNVILYEERDELSIHHAAGRVDYN